MVKTKRSEDGGKYLTKEWNDPDGKRHKCIYDQRGFSETERDYYDVTGTGIHDGKGYELDDACTLRTQPFDPEYQRSKRIDIRDFPEVGW